MGYEFKCDSCSREIRVKWLKPGEPALCRGCGHKMVVPAEPREIDNSLAEDDSPGQAPAPAAPRPGTCPSCRWLGKPGAFSLDAIGTCRRFPPSPQGWPGVTESDWCGEYSPEP